MKEEESAFARPHTLEKLQHTDDKEESRVERRKSAREERESKRVGARGDRGEEAGEGTRNGVYSSCFFLSFVDSALLCSRRGESSALCSTIRLHSGAVGRERERERGKTAEFANAREGCRSARAMHTCILEREGGYGTGALRDTWRPSSLYRLT